MLMETFFPRRKVALPETERSSLLSSTGGAAGVKGQAQRAQVIKALLYGLQVFYSFFIM